MLKMNISFRKFLEVALTILIMILMSKRMAIQLYIMSGKNVLFSTTSFYIVTLLVFILYLLYQGLKPKQKGYYLLFLLILLFLVFLSPALTPSYIGAVGEIRNMLFTYFSLFLLLIVLANDAKFVYRKQVLKTIVIFCLFQSILGIMQALLTIPIVPVEDNGESIVNTIYYLNGVSSKNAYYLNLGARIRAFGMTDSGLTLSLFALLGLVLQSIQKNKLVAWSFSAVFIVAIYLSYTRLVWILTVLALILMAMKTQLPRKLFNQFLSIIAYGGFILQGLMIAFIFVSNYFRDFALFPTLTSRLSGINYFLEVLYSDFSRILIGQNFLNRPLEFGVFSLDNELLKIIADIGILGLFILLATYFNAYIKLSRRSSVFLIFIALFGLGGFGNVLNYFFIPVTMFAILMDKESDNVNLNHYSSL